MSGGHYNYAFGQIDNLAYEISRDAKTPLRKAFVTHLQKVSRAAKAIEWNESGDGDPEEDALIMDCINKSDVIDEAVKDAEEALKNLIEAIEGGKPQ